MRKAYNDYALLENEDQFIGVSLGYDFTSEHEWGIKKIKELFGIPESSKKNMGIKSRTITKCPKNLIFKRDGEYALLWVAHVNWNGILVEKLPNDISNYKSDIKYEEKWLSKHSDEKKSRDPIVTAWDEGSFGVVVKGEKESNWIEYLYEQFQHKNVAIASMNLHPNNPFSNSSLTLAILDRLPEEITKMMYIADKKYYDLQDYEKKIGMVKLKERVIKERRKKGSDMYKDLHYYIACSPRWIDYEDEENREKRKKEKSTKYNISYWINYSDDDNNSGWYTVEEIMKWLKGDKKLTEVAPRKKD